MNQATIDARLIELGKGVIRARLYNRREAARRRAIVNIVNRHLNASANELKERLTEVGRYDEPISDSDIITELETMTGF